MLWISWLRSEDVDISGACRYRVHKVTDEVDNKDTEPLNSHGSTTCTTAQLSAYGSQSSPPETEVSHMNPTPTPTPDEDAQSDQALSAADVEQALNGVPRFSKPALVVIIASVVVSACGGWAYVWHAHSLGEAHTKALAACQQAVGADTMTGADVATRVSQAQALLDEVKDAKVITEDQRDAVSQAIEVVNGLPTALSCDPKASTKELNDTASKARAQDQALTALFDAVQSVEDTVLGQAVASLDAAVKAAGQFASDGGVKTKLDAAKSVDRTDRQAVTNAATALNTAVEAARSAKAAADAAAAAGAQAAGDTAAAVSDYTANTWGGSSSGGWSGGSDSGWSGSDSGWTPPAPSTDAGSSTSGGGNGMTPDGKHPVGEWVWGDGPDMCGGGGDEFGNTWDSPCD